MESSGGRVPAAGTGLDPSLLAQTSAHTKYRGSEDVSATTQFNLASRRIQGYTREKTLNLVKYTTSKSGVVEDKISVTIPVSSSQHYEQQAPDTHLTINHLLPPFYYKSLQIPSPGIKN